MDGWAFILFSENIFDFESEMQKNVYLCNAKHNN